MKACLGCFTLFCAGLISFHSASAQQQAPPLGGNSVSHICHLHPAGRHGADNEWWFLGIEVGPTESLANLVDEDWYVFYDHTHGNGACEDVDVKISVERAVEHSCSVGGSITLGGSVEAAAGALFANTKAVANASVSINASLSARETVTFQVQSATVLKPCKSKNYKFEKLRKTAAGSIDTFDHKFECFYLPVGWTSTVTSYCNPCNSKSY